MADVSALLKKLEQGTATQADLQQYASRLGRNAGREIAEMLDTRGTAETASWILQRLRTAHDEVTEYADGVQALQYEKTGVGLQPISPAFDPAGAENLAAEIERMITAEFQQAEILKKTEAYAQDVADRHMEANAAAASGAGLTVKVSRRYDGRGLRRGTKHAEACQWCLSRECTDLSYREAYAKGVFERHDGCHCVITYTSKKGVTTFQSGKGGRGSWADKSELEKRQKYGVDKELETLYNTSPPGLIGRLRTIYAEDVEAGWISPLSGFDNYYRLYLRIEREIVGSTTSNGIVITGQSRHFLQRTIGTLEDPVTHKRREGVDLADITDTLKNGNALPVNISKAGPSQVFVGIKCKVSVNPTTGLLIQCNPR